MWAFAREGLDDTPASSAIEKTDSSEVHSPPEVLKPRAPTPANSYRIVSATTPAQPTSLPVDQDGTDFSYFTTVKFGSSGKKLHMLIDTGAASTWVMSSDCKAKPCGVHNLFGEEDSTSLVSTQATFNVVYATGEVEGTIVNDTISLAGINVTISFGLASTVSDDFMTYPMDGILGLGRPRVGELNVESLVESLKTQQKLKSNVFGVSFQRHADNTRDGEISFGDWNRNKVSGDLTWVKTVNETGSWEVKVDDAGAGDKAAKFVGKTAIIDTGSSFNLLPPDDAKELHALFPDVKQAGEVFQLPCSTNLEVFFTFGGVNFTMSPDDYIGSPIDGQMCNSNIIGRQTIGPDQWLLGDAFLKNVYTVFDWDQNQIGKRIPVRPTVSTTALLILCRFRQESSPIDQQYHLRFVQRSKQLQFCFFLVDQLQYHLLNYLFHGNGGLH